MTIRILYKEGASINSEYFNTEHYYIEKLDDWLEIYEFSRSTVVFAVPRENVVLVRVVSQL
jgi:hypothetical protein